MKTSTSMTKGLVLGAIVLTALGLVAPAAQGATYVVRQDGAGDYTTIEEAFFATKGDGVDDVIEIQDSNTYSVPTTADLPSVPGNTAGLAEMDLLAGDGNLTVRAAAGQTPTIQSVAGGNRIFRNIASEPLVLRIEGASDTERLTLYGGSGDRPLVNCGPATGVGTYDIVNVNFVKPEAAGSGNAFMNLNANTDGTHYLTNVSLIGGNPEDAVAQQLITMGNALADQTNTPTIVIDNLDCSTATKGNAVGSGCLYIQGDCDAVISNSILTQHADAVAPGRWVVRGGGDGNPAGTDGGNTVEFIDCTFSVGGGGGWFRAFDTMGSNNYETNTYILTDPVFAGALGDVAFSGEYSKANVTVRGTDPANKVDLSPMATAGTVLVARATGGTWVYENVIDTVGFPAGLIDCASGNPLAADLNVIQNQCEWLEGRSGDFIDAGPGGDFSANFSATNVIWAGTTNQGHLLATIGAQTGPSTVTLDHCTIAKTTQNAFFFGNAGRGDTYTFSNCIIYTTQITESNALSSIGVTLVDPATNITYVNDPDNGSGNPYVGDAGLGGLAVDPLVDANGRLLADSPALGAAVGSTMAVDVDGTARPQPAGTANDIGAEESALTLALSITRTSPANVNVEEGETTAFMVTIANAAGDYTIEWFFNDGTGAVAIPNSDSPVLTITDVSTLDVGTYYCVVTDDNGPLQGPSFTVGLLAGMPIGAWPLMLVLPAAAVLALRRRRANG